MSDQSVRDLEKMVALFQSGGWKELSIETPSISLLLSRDTGTRGIAVSVPVAAPAVPAVPSAAPVQGLPVQQAAATSGVIDPAWSVIGAPNLGTFYRSPKPGTPPFVEVGQRIEAGTEVCLIEVMKLFTSVKAEAGGIVKHIAVADAELVEGGQALIYIGQE